MNYAFFVEIPKSQNNLSSVELNFVFFEPSLGLEEPVELSASDEWHDKEESEIRHKQVLHAYQELMLAFKHNVLFQFGIFDLIIFN